MLDSLASTVLQSSANTTAAVLAASTVLYTVSREGIRNRILLPSHCTLFPRSVPSCGLIPPHSLPQAWDGKGKFNPSAVTDVLTVKKGISSALVTLNKALSVAGLALIGLAFFPQLAASSTELLRNALAMLASHAAFSTVHYYGTPIVPAIQTWTSANRQAAIKIGALCLGGFAQNLLAVGYLQLVSRAVIVFGTLSLGIAHFLGERYGTGMPPAGYAAIACAAWGIVSVLTGSTVVA